MRPETGIFVRQGEPDQRIRQVVRLAGIEAEVAPGGARVFQRKQKMLPSAVEQARGLEPGFVFRAQPGREGLQGGKVAGQIDIGQAGRHQPHGDPHPEQDAAAQAQAAPALRQAAPTPEHLAPVFVVLGASTDADYLLQICKDNAGSPDGNWYHARPAMTTLTSGVSGGNLLSVALAKYFNPSNKVKIFRRSSKAWTAEYTIQSVNKSNNTITLVESVTADNGDWLHISRVNVGDIAPGGACPLWARGVSFIETVKQEKYQYLRAKENI